MLRHGALDTAAVAAFYFSEAERWRLAHGPAAGPTPPQGRLGAGGAGRQEANAQRSDLKAALRG